VFEQFDASLRFLFVGKIERFHLIIVSSVFSSLVILCAMIFQRGRCTEDDVLRHLGHGRAEPHYSIAFVRILREK